jgi:hypothetical protein
MFVACDATFGGRWPKARSLDRRKASGQVLPDITVCARCGTENHRRATMCAWCETHLGPPDPVHRLPSVESGDVPLDGPAVSRRWGTANVLVVGTLSMIALICPVMVGYLLNKQHEIDELASYYTGPDAHRPTVVPHYAVLSLIPMFTCALMILLIFLWVTRSPRDTD